MEEKRKNLKIKRETWKGLRQLAVDSDMTIQDIADTALDAHIESQRKKELRKETK
jgi:hypothetical protein